MFVTHNIKMQYRVESMGLPATNMYAAYLLE